MVARAKKGKQWGKRSGYMIFPHVDRRNNRLPANFFAPIILPIRITKRGETCSTWCLRIWSRSMAMNDPDAIQFY